MRNLKKKIERRNVLSTNHVSSNILNKRLIDDLYQGHIKNN
jgi:hypothetical protein